MSDDKGKNDRSKRWERSNYNYNSNVNNNSAVASNENNILQETHVSVVVSAGNRINERVRGKMSRKFGRGGDDK